VLAGSFGDLPANKEARSDPVVLESLRLLDEDEILPRVLPGLPDPACDEPPERAALEKPPPEEPPPEWPPLELAPVLEFPPAPQECSARRVIEMTRSTAMTKAESRIEHLQTSPSREEIRRQA